MGVVVGMGKLVWMELGRLCLVGADWRERPWRCDRQATDVEGKP